MSETPVFQAPFDLGSVGETRTETLVPKPDALKRIAEWAELETLESLKAVVRVSRVGDDLYSFEGQLSADLVQSCVVTLTPVRSHIEREFSRRYQLVRKRRGRQEPEEEVALEGEDEVETVSHKVIDLAAPVLEELTLAIDPYPRAPGAVFDLPAEEEKAEPNPFAVLKDLPVTKGRAAPKARKS